MRWKLKIWAKTVALLFTSGCLCSCITPEERALEAEAKIKLAIRVHTVVIQQMKFMPEDLTVNTGDTVIWINRDIVDHNVTEEVGKEWTSGNMPSGSSWKMAVVKSAAYFCTIHPVMKGSLSVR